MREHSSFRQGQKKAEERKKLLKIAAIPVAVILLILVIVIADRDKNEPKQAETETFAELEKKSEQELKQEEEQESDQEHAAAQAEEPEPELEEMEAPPKKQILMKDAFPEIVVLMKDYYQARATGDAELLNRLYGIEGLSVTQLESEKTRMRSNSKYLRNFDNIVTYTAEGLTEHEWLVYSTCDMHFHSIETTAPMIMWCYVVKQEDGTLLLQNPEELSSEVLQYVERVNRSQEVRSLASDINVRLKEALTSDTELNAIYGVLRDGSPVYEDEEAQARMAVKILDELETEADMMTGSETTEESESPEESIEESESIEEQKNSEQ